MTQGLARTRRKVHAVRAGYQVKMWVPEFCRERSLDDELADGHMADDPDITLSLQNGNVRVLEKPHSRGQIHITGE